MREVLKALDIAANNQKDYNTQFGIVLNIPTLQPIVPAPTKLMADVSGAAVSTSTQNPSASLINDAGNTATDTAALVSCPQ